MKPSCRHAVTPVSLLLRLGVVLLVIGVLLRGAAVQLGDVPLGHVALACIGLGVAGLVASLHAWLDRFLEPRS
jgi:hypothetical protein